MGEYEDWVRRQAVEKARIDETVRRNAQVAREAAEREHQRHRESVEAEARRKLKEPSDKLERVLRDALSSEFNRARTSRITQSLEWVDVRYPHLAKNRVTAAWGNKLGFSSDEKRTVEEKRGYFRHTPPTIIEKDCKELAFSVGYQEITLNLGGLNGYPTLKLESFMTDHRTLFPLIQTGLSANNIKKFEDWEWFTKDEHNNYMSREDRNEWYRRDAQDA